MRVLALAMVAIATGFHPASSQSFGRQQREIQTPFVQNVPYDKLRDRLTADNQKLVWTTPKTR